VEVEATGVFMLAGNATLLAALLRNLLDNAIRYSPPGAQIRLSLSQAASHVRLTVADSGPGLSEADLQRLGERFFRVLGHEQPGSGLGWSIVRRIVAAHGGRVQLSRSAELGGLSVQIDWPGASV